MKSTLGLTLALLILASCGGTENAGDELTDGERAYLRTQAIAKCKSDSEANLQSYIADSNNAFGTSDYYRNKTWKYEWKVSGGSATKTMKLTSWKQDANNLYFINTIENEGTTSYQFIKITKPVNKVMIEELRDRYCITQSVKDTVGYSSFSSSSASYQIVARTQTSSTEDQKTTDKFSFSSNYPAYFSAFNESKKIEKITRETDVIASTTTYTGTLTVAADEAPAHVNYNNYTSYGVKYCIVKPGTGGSYTYGIPYELNCEATVAEFNPEELCRVNAANCSF